MAEKMKILVVGGAGYIGSHMVELLMQQGYQVVVYDNLSSGYADAVLEAELIIGDLADKSALVELFTTNKFAAVMHFASSIQVGESVIKPAKYYRNNVLNTVNLLDVMLEHKVNHFIFSSTAAIFGEPESVPIKGGDPKLPVNPYGRSKWMVEQILQDYEHAYGLKSICLRYFNAAGADPQGRIGERHDPETHLIPLILQVVSGRRDKIFVYGNDYPTKDGTCVRDYIHIVDLCMAHLLALQSLQAGHKSDAYNLGNGNGFSVLEVINVVQEVSGQAVAVEYAARRDGDPAILIADATRIKQELGWRPEYHDLATIVRHALEWEKVLIDQAK